METLALGPHGRTTSRLGFGGSSIMGVLDRRQSLALLESAFDAGIRHFDTAPMYGFGESESCLGDFLARHRGAITVTTKFGIPAGSQGTLARAIRGLARPVLRTFPSLKKSLQAAPSTPGTVAAGPREPNPIFTAEQARQSLERSLTQLKTDRLDLWLLHEVRAIDLAPETQNGPLLRFLEDAVAQGKVGCFGAGSDRSDIPALLAGYPAYCPVLQYEWSVLDAAIVEPGPFRIHHRALSQHFQSLAAMLQNDPSLCSRWSGEVGQDLAARDMLARLMLKASYLLNPASLLLFSSKSPKHIADNVATLADATLDASARRLYALFQREPPVLHG